MTADEVFMAQTRRPPRGGPSHAFVTEGLLIPLAAAGLPLVLIVAEVDVRVLEIPDHLQPIDRVVVVLDAVVEPGRVAFYVLLHPDGVLRHDDRLAARELDP